MGVWGSFHTKEQGHIWTPHLGGAKPILQGGRRDWTEVWVEAAPSFVSGMGPGCQAATVDTGGRGVLGAHALDLVFLFLSLASLQAHTQASQSCRSWLRAGGSHAGGLSPNLSSGFHCTLPDAFWWLPLMPRQQLTPPARPKGSHLCRSSVYTTFPRPLSCPHHHFPGLKPQRLQMALSLSLCTTWNHLLVLVNFPLLT